MVTAQEFHNAWCEAAKAKESEICRNWTKPKDFTSTMMYDDKSVIDLISKKLGLNHFSEYYCIDKVLYKQDNNIQDLVPDRPKDTIWLRRIRVAFEHESNFHSGLYKEISHLLITQCELRVLVSYPNCENDIQKELNSLHKLISESDIAQEISKRGSLLFILGWKCNDEILWFGCLFHITGWKLLPQASLATDIKNALNKSNLKESLFKNKPVDSLL